MTYSDWPDSKTFTLLLAIDITLPGGKAGAHWFGWGESAECAFEPIFF